MAMRLLLWHRKQFSNAAIKEIISQRKEWMEKLQRAQFTKYEKIFTKIYDRHLLDVKIQKERQTHLKQMCLLSDLPSRSIIDYFQGEARQFSEDFTIATFIHLAKAARASEFDHNSSLDHYGYRLFNSPEFQNLSEQIKYGLRERKFSLENSIRIGQACLTLQYADYELFTLLMDYYHRFVSSNEQYKSVNHHNQRYFQIEKEGYFNFKDLVNKDQLLSKKSFKEMLEILKQKHLYEPTETQAINLGQDSTVSEEDKKVIEDLLKTVQHAQEDFNKLVSAVISLRDGYKRMVKFSGQQSISRESRIVLQLLELEQSLIQAKILNIDDIRNQTFLDKKIQQVARIEQVMTRILNLESLDEYQVIAKRPQQQVIEKDPYQQLLKQVETINKIVTIVSGFAELDRHLYCNNQSRSLISLKWEKTLLNNDSVSEDLNAPRYLRRLYKDCFEFVKRYQVKFQRLFRKAPVDCSLPYWNALLNMGLYTQAIALVQKNSLSSLKIDEISHQKLAVLMSFLNNLGVNCKQQYFQGDLLTRLSKLPEQEQIEQIQLSLRFCLDVCNYLIQCCNLQIKQNAQIYSIYLNHLQKIAKYYIGYQRKNKDVQEAFKILALEHPSKYANSSQYTQFLQQKSIAESKMNPHLKFVSQIVCKNYLNIPLNSVELAEFLQIGSMAGQPHALMFIGASDASLDGNYITGDTHSYILRLQKSKGVVISPLIINRLFKIDYSQEDKVIKMISAPQIDRVIKKAIHPDIFQLSEFTATMRNIHQNIVETFQEFNELPVEELEELEENKEDKTAYIPKIVEKIGLQIQFIEKVAKIRNQSKTEAQSISRDINVFNLILELEKDFKFYESVTEQEEFPKLAETAKEPIKSMLQTLQKRIKLFKSPEMADITGVDLGGRRQTIQVLDKNDQPNLGSVGSQLIDSIYYLDQTYLEYADWKKQIQHVYETNSRKYEEMSPQNKILIKKYCKKINHVASIIPLIQKNQKIKLFDINMERVYPQNNQTQTPSKSQEFIQEQQKWKMIINLQNFKHKLKVSKTKDELIEYIFSFKFINQLNSPQPFKPELSLDLLPRGGQAYFSYLQGKAQKQALQSPYITYILNKLQHKEDVKELFRERTATRLYNRTQFRQGKITRQQYYDAVGKVEDRIIAALQGFKEKMLDSMDDTLLSGGLKMVTTEVNDINDIMAWFRRAPHFDRALDQDYVLSDGDYTVALYRKRERAQSNLVKMALLKRAANGELTKSDQKEIQDWKQKIEQSLHQYQIHDGFNFTNLKIKDLCPQDLNKLNLSECNLAENKEMLLIDLIFEFNNFLDERLLKQVDSKFLGSTMQKKYEFNPELFVFSSNKEFSELTYERERVLMDKASKLKEKELDTVEDMVKVFKVQGFNDRNRYATIFAGFRNILEQMNSTPLRGQFITQYVKKLEWEYFSEYNPLLIAQIKERQTKNLWKNTFGSPENQTSEKDVRRVVKLICSRIQAMRNRVPPFFGNLVVKILQHPLTGDLLKETLIASIDHYKVDLKLDSKDLKDLLDGIIEISDEQINQRMRLIANKNFTEAIHSRISLIL